MTINTSITSQLCTKKYPIFIKVPVKYLFMVRFSSWYIARYTCKLGSGKVMYNHGFNPLKLGPGKVMYNHGFNPLKLGSGKVMYNHGFNPLKLGPALQINT